MVLDTAGIMVDGKLYVIQIIQLRLSFQKRKLLIVSLQWMMDYCLFRPKCSGNYFCSK